MLLNVLLALLIVVGVALTGLVLLQRSEGGALGMGGGGQLVSARGAANFLTRTTWWFGISFFALALLITVILGHQAGTGSITDKVKIQALDPTKMAAEQKAAFDEAQAKLKGQLKAPTGFTAPAPSVGVTPFSGPAQAPAPSGAPFSAPAPKSTAPAAAPKAAAPKAAAPKAAAPAAPAPAADLPILPTPNP